MAATPVKAICKCCSTVFGPNLNPHFHFIAFLVPLINILTSLQAWLLRNLGFNSQCGHRLSSSSQYPDPLWGPPTLLSNMPVSLFFLGLSGQSMNVTTHLQARLRIHGDIPPLPAHLMEWNLIMHNWLPFLPFYEKTLLILTRKATISQAKNGHFCCLSIFVHFFSFNFKLPSEPKEHLLIL
jgi:hypothetical protein